MVDIVMGLCTLVFLIRTYQLSKSKNAVIPKKVSREYAIVVFIIGYAQCLGGLYISSIMNALTAMCWLDIYLYKSDTGISKKE